MKWQKITLMFFLWAGYVLPIAASTHPTTWQSIAAGLEYAQLSDFPSFPNGYIHAFKINLAYYNLKIRFPQSEITLPELMQQEKAVLAINGGFFTSEFTPLGLRISQGQLLSPLRPITWWGVFYIIGKRAAIVSQKNYQPNKIVDFAIQAGPRLLDNQHIPKLKPDIDYRTALGVTRTGQIILLATENLMLSTGDLAAIMQRPATAGGLDCVEALNLDGGHSTQLYTHLQNLSLQVKSYTPVADSILVVPKDVVPQ